MNVDMIIQNVSEDGYTDVSFTVSREDCARAVQAWAYTAAGIGAKGITQDERIAKVSVVGVGMKSHKGVASTMFGTARAGGDQHRDDLHERHQDLLRGGRGPDLERARARRTRRRGGQEAGQER